MQAALKPGSHIALHPGEDITFMQPITCFKVDIPKRNKYLRKSSFKGSRYAG